MNFEMQCNSLLDVAVRAFQQLASSLGTHASEFAQLCDLALQSFGCLSCLFLCLLSIDFCLFLCPGLPVSVSLPLCFLSCLRLRANLINSRHIDGCTQCL